MALWETHFIHSIASLWMCFMYLSYVGALLTALSAPIKRGFSKPPLRPFKKRLWIPLVLEKLLIHPNRRTCPFPVSVYYTAMILLRGLPLQQNTICFHLSLISFSHHLRHAFAEPNTLKSLTSPIPFFPPFTSPNISKHCGFKLIYSHNKSAQHFNSIVSNFKLSQ